MIGQPNILLIVTDQEYAHQAVPSDFALPSRDRIRARGVTFDHHHSTRTMVWAEQLSRPAVDSAIRRGHAYVQGLGRASPSMELRATAADGSTGIFGDTLVTDQATVSITVRGGGGQVLSVRRNGTEVERVPITAPEFTHTVAATRTDDEGPLGTFWGAEVLDTTRFEGAEVPTVIANPVFLADRPAAAVDTPRFRATGSIRPVTESTPAPDAGTGGRSWGPLAGIAAVVTLLAAGAVVVVRRRRSG